MNIVVSPGWSGLLEALPSLRHARPHALQRAWAEQRAHRGPGHPQICLQPSRCSEPGTVSIHLYTKPSCVCFP